MNLPQYLVTAAGRMTSEYRLVVFTLIGCAGAALLGLLVAFWALGPGLGLLGAAAVVGAAAIYGYPQARANVKAAAEASRPPAPPSRTV